MSNFSEQFTIPYATNIGILTGSDFTIDSREKIYLRENKTTDRYVILFYRENESDSQKLRAIQRIFIDTGSKGFQDISFKVCNLSADKTLNNAFKEVIDTPAHPFNWIQNAANPNIFILIYYSGYPQMFYEGPLEVSIFSDFIITNLSTKTKSESLFEKYNSGNGFVDKDIKKTYVEQAWNKFTPSSGVSVADALIKPENIPSGLRAIAKGEYIGPPPSLSSNQYNQLPSKDAKIRQQKTVSWAEKINQIYKGDNTKSQVQGIQNSGLVKNGKEENLISDAFEESPYIDYLLSYEGKNSDNKLKGLVSEVYKIAKKLYILKDAYNLKPEDIAKLSINMFGFYKFKEKDPSVKVDKADELEALYISQNVISKFANVNPIFAQQIAKIVANEILNEEGTIKIAQAIQKSFNDNKGGENKNEISLDDAKIIVDYFRDKMEELVTNDDNKNKSNDEKRAIKSEPDNYDISSDETFPFKSDDIDEKTNQRLEDLINNDSDVKKFIIKKVMNPQQGGGQQQQQQDSGGGGGGNVFSYKKKNRRD